MPGIAVTVFRNLDVEASVRIGFSVMLRNFPLWFLCGAALGFLNPWLTTSAEGGAFAFLPKTVIFCALFLWPASVGAKTVFRLRDEEPVTPEVLFSPGGLPNFIVTGLIYLVMATAGGMLFDWLLSRAMGPEVTRAYQFMGDPVTGMRIIRFYPLVVLGAMTLALPYALAPFAALDRGLGFLDALWYGRHLARDLKMVMLFLQGTMFFAASIAFLLGFLAGGDGIGSHIASHLVFAAAFGFGGAVWGDAYRQALTLETMGLPRAETSKRLYRVT